MKRASGAATRPRDPSGPHLANRRRGRTVQRICRVRHRRHQAVAAAAGDPVNEGAGRLAVDCASPFVRAFEGGTRMQLGVEPVGKVGAALSVRAEPVATAMVVCPRDRRRRAADISGSTNGPRRCQRTGSPPTKATAGAVEAIEDSLSSPAKSGHDAFVAQNWRSGLVPADRVDSDRVDSGGAAGQSDRGCAQHRRPPSASSPCPAAARTHRACRPRR